MTIRRLERIALDGSTVSISFGRILAPCLKVSYADKLEPEDLTFMGSQSIDAQTPGKYSTEEAKISMESVVFRSELYPFLDKNGYGNRKIPIVIGYFHPDLGDDTDLLDRARIVGISQAAENSGKALEVEFGIRFMQLYVGNSRITINKMDPSLPLGASKF